LLALMDGLDSRGQVPPATTTSTSPPPPDY
jgi:hypothetical protein